MQRRTLLLIGLIFLMLLLIAAKQQSRSSAPAPLVSTAVRSATTTSAIITRTASSTALTLRGTYLGLLDAQDRLDRTYDYLLLDTGTQIKRIDLRPLYKMDFIHIRERLGLQPHEPITVDGLVKNGVFTVQKIQATP